MRVRVLRDFSTANDAYHVGQVVEIDPRKAGDWLRSGKVMQDKSQDGASETKAIVSPSKQRRSRTRR